VLNTQEHATLDQSLERELTPLSLEQALALAGDGAQLLDTREPARFEGAHLDGSVNVGLGGSFATWSGTLLDHDRPIVVIAEPGREVEAATRLGRIGFDNVAGYLGGGMQEVEESGARVTRTERITAASLAEVSRGPDAPLVVDVRSPGEWKAGHIDGAINAPLSRLADDLDRLPADRPLVVYCTSGYRSAIAASVLRRAGRTDVADLVGGLEAWKASGALTPGTISR
jgi:hydroxyacylglutathione hydrolase